MIGKWEKARTIGALALLLFPIGTASASETVTYRYDERGRLVQVNHSGTINNGVSACYALDRADNRKKVTVATADCATFSVSAGSVAANEGAQLTFLISKVGGSQTAFTVDYASSNGTAVAGSDYMAATGTLSFAAGETQKAVTVGTTDDSTVEPDETFVLTLSNPSGGATIAGSQTVGTILNND